MSLWECTIDGCSERFDRVEDAIVHQTTEHDRHECNVCGAVVPDGYLAIRHAFDEHTRADYVRAYDADSEEVRTREEIKAEVEAHVDFEEVVQRLDGRA